MTMSPARLRRILRYRARLERVQEARFAEARRATAERAAHVAAAHERRGGVLAWQPGLGGVDPDVLQAGVAALGRLDREIVAGSAALAHSRNQESTALETLLEKRRHRRAMELLHERQTERLREQARRAEQARLDEIATVRWWRNRRLTQGGETA